MTSYHEAKLTMFRNTELTCRKHLDILPTVPAFNKCFQLLEIKILAITTLAASEKDVTKGVGTSKRMSQVTACSIGADTAGLLFAYASATGNHQLKASMDFAITDLKRLKKESLVPTLQNILKGAEANFKPLEDYGLSETHLTVLRLAIGDYTDKLAKPQNARTLRTTYTKGIKNLVRETDILLKEQMDKLIVGYKNDQPTLVAEYRAARTVYDPPSQRTQIKGIVLAVDSDKQVKNAKVTLSGPTELVLQTNESGSFDIKPLPPGTYQVLVKADGFAETVVENLVVKLGKVTRVSLSLKAA